MAARLRLLTTMQKNREGNAGEKPKNEMLPGNSPLYHEWLWELLKRYSYKKREHQKLHEQAPYFIHDTRIAQSEAADNPASSLCRQFPQRSFTPSLSGFQVWGTLKGFSNSLH